MQLHQTMDDSETPELDRLIALVDEAERILSKSIASHDIRHACALARGYLDLARYYHEPVKVEDVERVLQKMRAMLASDKRKQKLGFHPDSVES